MAYIIIRQSLWLSLIVFKINGSDMLDLAAGVIMIGLAVAFGKIAQSSHDPDDDNRERGKASCVRRHAIQEKPDIVIERTFFEDIKGATGQAVRFTFLATIIGIEVFIAVVFVDDGDDTIGTEKNFQSFVNKHCPG